MVKVRKVCDKAFFGVFTLMFLILLYHLITQSAHVGLLILGMLGVVLILVSSRFLFEKFKSGLEKVYNILFVGFLGLFFVTQVICAYYLEHTPTFDLEAIYNGGIQWAETGSFSNYHEYFYYFPNNFGGLFYYRVIFLVARVFHITNYYMVASVCNSLLSLGTMYCVVRICETLMSKQAGLVSMLLFMISPVFWFIAPVFYTDSITMLFPVLLFYLYLKICNTSNKKQQIVFSCVFVVTAIVGCFLKFTVVIVLIAMLVTCLFIKQWKRILCVLLASLVLGLCSNFLFETYMYNTHLDKSVAEVQNTPYLHWVMMGLQGDGCYNPYDYELSRSFPTIQERDVGLKQEIQNRISNLGVTGMWDLVWRKLCVVFGSGTLNQSDFLDDGPVRYNSLHDFLLYGSKDYDTYELICQVIFYAVILLLVFQGVFNLLNEQTDTNSLLLCVAMFGVALFFMMWETSGRYITNFVPVMYVIAILAVNNIFEKVRLLHGSSIVSRDSVL